MKTPPPMTPFDEATSSNLRMLKLFLPFLPSSAQYLLAVFIKFTELQNVFTLHTLNQIENLDYLFPYLTEEEKEYFSTLKNIKEMMSMAEMMNSFMDIDFPGDCPNHTSDNPSTHSPNNTSNSFDPISILTGMLSPEQQNTFQTYSELFSQSLSKGATQNGKLDESSCNEDNRSPQTGADPDSCETDTGEIRK